MSLPETVRQHGHIALAGHSIVLHKGAAKQRPGSENIKKAGGGHHAGHLFGITSEIYGRVNEYSDVVEAMVLLAPVKEVRAGNYVAVA